MTALRTGRLDIEVTGARATLAGRIDDVAQLGATASLLPDGDVELDLAGVTFVSSIGMRAPACGHEATLLIDAVGHAAALAAMTAPRLPCPECGAAMALADFAERYLSVFGG